TVGYNAASGYVSSLTSPDGLLQFGYDGPLLSDVTWTGSGLSASLHRTFDASLRIASESVNGGTAVAYGYDRDNLLTSAGALTITRDPSTGLVTGTTIGSINESRTYNQYGEEQTYTV